MNLVSLSILRTRAQQAANMEGSSFVSNSEWLSYINYGAKRLHDILCSKFPDEYWLNTSVVTITSGTDTYALPADFYRLQGVDLAIGSTQKISLQRFQLRDRNRYNWAMVNWGAVGAAPLYMLAGPKIKFLPMPSLSGPVITLWYYPTLQKTTDSGATWVSGDLAGDTDQIDDVLGFGELIVLDAAIRARQKESTDASVLISQRNEVMAWIERAAAQRNAGEPTFIGDVAPDNGPFVGGPWSM